MVIGPIINLIAIGMYLASIEVSISKNTRAGDGKIISVMFRIIGPSYAGAVLYHNFLIESKTHPGAAYYGTQAFLGLLDNLGLPHDTDSDDIVGRKVYINVDIKDGNLGPQNTITGFSKVEESNGATPADSDINDIPF